MERSGIDEGQRIMTRALVTGATGLLGGHLVSALLAAGVEVRAYVRPTSDLRHLRTLPVEIVTSDDSGADALRRAVAGIEHVFHAAGYLSLSSPFDGVRNDSRYRLVNVELTGRLLAASLEAGVRRFVFASSPSVYALDVPVPTSEDAPLRPISDYGHSKLEAEELVRAFQARGLNSTVVRPCLLYGPGDRYFLPAALRLVSLPILPLVNGGRNLLDLAYVQDVVELMLRASRAEAAVGRVYNAGPGAPTSLADLAAAYRRVTGRGPRIVAVSVEAARRSAPLSRWLLARMVPGAQAFLTPAGLDLMARDIHLDMSRARDELGYVPRFNLEQGIAATLAQSGGPAPQIRTD